MSLALLSLSLCYTAAANPLYYSLAPLPEHELNHTSLAGLPISSVSLTNPGWYYATAPFVSITGGSGSGAIVTSTIKDGKVISSNIVSAGSD